jgi:hypothetical protein
MPPKSIMQVRVRMPRDLHKKIQREADRHGQTINAEILVRLEGSFEIKQTLDRVEEMVRSLLPTTVYVPEERRTDITRADWESPVVPEKRRSIISNVAPKGDKSDD